MKKFSVAVLGCGGRGLVYSDFINAKKEQFEIVALCDTNPKQIEKIQKFIGKGTSQIFYDSNEFLKEKRADLLIIATPDRQHVPQAVRALELGYDVLLEKPISDSREELEELLDAQKKFGGQVMICHVLRYGNGYRKCAELLNSGKIGRLYAIDASERVAYWHWAQAYVRGVGASISEGHPAILAKCSHDLDIVQYYANSRCESVSSIGGLDFFLPENAPEGAADRCLDCKHKNTCPYSAKRIYIDAWHKAGRPEWAWPYTKVSIDKPHTEEKLFEGLKTNENGRCAFKCEVEKVDNQMVQMTFENGVKASLKMIYAAYPGRRITLYGTLGEIIFDEREDTVTLMQFGGEPKIIDIGSGEKQGHSGDEILINELYTMLTDSSSCTTSLEKSVEAHLMGICAEESRKLGGTLIKVHK